MTNGIKQLTKPVSDYLGQLFSTPFIAAAAKLTPQTAFISAYFASQYAKDQAEALKTFIDLMASRLILIERNYLDKDFFETPDGRRLAVQIVKSVLRDSRKEKIQAMANLAVNFHIKTGLTVDEKELYVNILDELNPLQLSILHKAVQVMRARTVNIHRGFGWEIMEKEYSQKGVPKHLLLQSIRVLESNGLVNKNSAIAQEADQTHFLTDFGEKFYDFMADALKEDSPYL